MHSPTWPLRRWPALAALAAALFLATLAPGPASAEACPPPPAPNIVAGDVWLPVGPGRNLDMGLLVSNPEDEPRTVDVWYVGDDGTCSRVADPFTIPGHATSAPILRAPLHDVGAIWISPQGGGRIEATINHRDLSRGTEKVGLATSLGARTSEAATSLGLPLLMSDNDQTPNSPADPPDNGISTWFRVQNTSATTVAEITIRYVYVDLAGIQRSTTVEGTLPPRASKRFDQRGVTDPGWGNLRLPEVFAGEVTSSQPVVATVMQQGGPGLFSYSGFRPEATSFRMAAPLIMSSNAARNEPPLYTGIQAQNTGDVATDITISFSVNIAKPLENYPPPCGGVGWVPPAKVFRNVPAGASVTHIQLPGDPKLGFDDDKDEHGNTARRFTGEDGKPCRYIGSAIVHTAGSNQQPLAVIVNQIGRLSASAYEGRPLHGTPGVDGSRKEVSLVNVDTRVPGNPAILTGINVMLSTQQPVALRITLTPNVSKDPDACPTPDQPLRFGPASDERVVNVVLGGTPPGDDPNRAQLAKLDGCVYVGSATITYEPANVPHDPPLLFVVVNQFSPWWSFDGLGTVSLP